jgi:hypothetical protein
MLVLVPIYSERNSLSKKRVEHVNNNTTMMAVLKCWSCPFLSLGLSFPKGKSSFLKYQWLANLRCHQNLWEVLVSLIQQVWVEVWESSFLKCPQQRLILQKDI